MKVAVKVQAFGSVVSGKRVALHTVPPDGHCR